MSTVNEIIAAGEWSSALAARRDMVGIYSTRYSIHAPSEASDGFGWVASHIDTRKHIVPGNAYRSKRAAWAAKSALPLAVNILIWNPDQMMEHLRRYWSRYTQEEREDISRAMAGYGFKPKSQEDIHNGSAFVRWAKIMEEQLATV